MNPVGLPPLGSRSPAPVSGDVIRITCDTADPAFTPGRLYVVRSAAVEEDGTVTVWLRDGLPALMSDLGDTWEIVLGTNEGWPAPNEPDT